MAFMKAAIRPAFDKEKKRYKMIGMEINMVVSDSIKALELYESVFGGGAR